MRVRVLLMRGGKRENIPHRRIDKLQLISFDLIFFAHVQLKERKMICISYLQTKNEILLAQHSLLLSVSPSRFLAISIVAINDDLTKRLRLSLVHYIYD